MVHPVYKTLIFYFQNLYILITFSAIADSNRLYVKRIQMGKILRYYTLLTHF